MLHRLLKNYGIMSEINEEKMELILTPGLKNKYGKWVDKETGKFIRWAKNPKTLEAMEQRRGEIRHMIKEGISDKLTDKELHRLLKIYNKPHIGVEAQWYDSVTIMQE